MELSKIIKLLPTFIDANVCVEIRGHSGIGKSDMIAQFREDMERTTGLSWGIGSHYAATWTPSDVTGFLMPRTATVTMPDGTTQEKIVSEWSAPVWLRADRGQKFEFLNDFDRAILVLEEFDKANPEVKKPCAPLILYGGFGDWWLKQGTARIILSNHADDGRQGSTKEFDFVINRKVLYSATQSLESWTTWAAKAGIHPLFIAFVEEHPATVFGNNLPEKQGPFCTARSLCMLESVAKRGLIDDDGQIIDDEAFVETASGAIGSVATRDLTTFFKFKDEVPGWNDIKNNPGGAKVPTNAAAQLMAAHIAAYNVDPNTCSAAVHYVQRLRPEFYITFAKAATKRNFRLTNAPAFVKWTKDHPQLVALINALGGGR